MIIKVKTKTDIIWPVVLLYILQCYVVSSEMFVLICGACIGLYILAARKISIPKVPGLILYLANIIFITFIGFTRFTINLVVKDLFYEISNLVPIILGYYLYSLYGKTKSMWKTVCLLATISSVVCIFEGIGAIGKGVDFSTLKEIFGFQVITLGIIFPILVGKRFIFHEITFTKIKDIIIIIILAIQLMLSVSRAAIIGVVIGFCVMFIVGNLNKKISFNLIGRTIVLAACISVIGIVAWNTMPDSVTSTLSDKFSKTFTEIDSSTEFVNTGDAQNDWRGYEIHCAKEQWKSNDIIKEIFGEGNGSLILINFVPVQFKDIILSQSGGIGISVLHNTYYTLLVKGGLLTLALFIYLFLANIKKGIVCIRSVEKEKFFYGAALIVICIGILVNAYVVRSMFEKSALFACTLLIGWINAEIADKKYKEANEKGV